MIIKNLTDSESVEKANIALGDSDKLIYLYDISLVKMVFQFNQIAQQQLKSRLHIKMLKFTK